MFFLLLQGNLQFRPHQIITMCIEPSYSKYLDTEETWCTHRSLKLLFLSYNDYTIFKEIQRKGTSQLAKYFWIDITASNCIHTSLYALVTANGTSNLFTALYSWQWIVYTTVNWFNPSTVTGYICHFVCWCKLGVIMHSWSDRLNLVKFQLPSIRGT